ncbi:MAG: type II secretion system GspH family protein [Firmicutes bacterium]|nr:type II secretion system GspH family protein [Bacillota bacterium]
MHARVKRFLKSNSGFTLIELIIVIGIMGFLVAMIAPRLAGVMGGAVDAVCDSNQTRLETVMASYTEQYAAIPNNLINLVVEETTGVYTALNPLVEDANKGNGVEVFSADFIEGIEARMHYLNADEAAELISLGVSQVRNLNLSEEVTHYNGNEMNWNKASMPDATLGHMAPVTPAEGVPVLMYGGGYSSGATPTLDAITSGDVLRQPDLAFRIVLGVGPDSDLVQDGLISKAGMCPGGLQRSDHFAYNNYNIALPRLGATVERLPNDVLTMYC